MPGSLGAILCRTRYIDDVFVKSLGVGLDQVVILGAGFDSRAYRISGLEAVRVFEVDFPGTRNLKQARLEKVLGSVPKNVILVGINFEEQTLDEVLTVEGFQVGKRTFFIWEGVTQYITDEAVDRTLNFVANTSGAGSKIVFTYVRRGLIDGTDREEWMNPFLSFARRVGSPFIFGIDPDEIEQFLAEHGMNLIEDVGASDYQTRYLKPLRRELNVFDGERAVYAEVVIPIG